ncbi:MAG: hypothetical protein JSS02_19850, partial [Planctomycetes bacterium]|nr:hypothetical protein [Planctomycetota bacterium]
MLRILTAPAANSRGPRYMERALAAIHQSNRVGFICTLGFGLYDARSVLIVESPDEFEEQFFGPIAANYPNCSLTAPEDQAKGPKFASTWYAHLKLIPDLFPILRHAQFEDLLNGTFADPITNILRAIRPEGGIECRVEIAILPITHSRQGRAGRAIRRLNREFFRRYHELAHFYARNVERPWGWMPAAILGLVALGTPDSHHSSIDTS